MITVTPKKQDDGTRLAAAQPRVGEERVFATHNLADKCTWFGESERVTEETLEDDGDGLTFNSDHTHWIDMVTGRTHRDDYWSALQGTHGYLVTVTVNDVEKTMRTPFASSGGDFEVIWDTGQIVFFSSQSGNTVKASYSYATGSTFVLKPLTNKKLIIESAEADFSIDTVLNDAIEYSVWVDHPTYGLIEVQKDYFRRIQTIIQEAKGAYPLVNAVGATTAQKALELQEFRRTCRGMRTDYMAIPFAYQTVRELTSVENALELHVKTQNDEELGGELSSLTFYCTEWDDQ